MRKTRNIQRPLGLLILVVLIISLAACHTGNENGAGQITQATQAGEKDGQPIAVIQGEPYSTKDEVATYIKQFQALPPNYLTKQEATDLGWDNTQGNLWDVAEGMSIGGDRFGNREGLLPAAKDRQYYECDVDYQGGYRGAERIVYSNDGLVYYTADHYKTFTQIE
ncbi:MAG TPA: ribonuclease [Peptococcaceae bacterium]|nr:ribonuclease [Peptococcaceae bacterium]